ncbi:MAG: hypothetical protein JW940_28410 [Polyangiaceae bacterium]|nr:hypothetical protein [Polyangiaceae bacterium]
MRPGAILKRGVETPAHPGRSEHDSASTTLHREHAGDRWAIAGLPQVERSPAGYYVLGVSFRDRLLATLRSCRAVLEVPGVLVGGSEVPNLLEQGAASSLVVSEDVDLIIPVSQHAEVKQRLGTLNGLRQSRDEPSVFVPDSADLIELNFIGSDQDPSRLGDVYVLEDPALPMLVFGNLGLLRPGRPIQVEGLSVPVPRPSGLMLEKLVTDRSGVKGDRDLLVVLGLLMVAEEADVAELVATYQTLPDEFRYHVRANLSLLSLLEPRSGMPDPTLHRARISALLARLEQHHGSWS